MGADSRVDNQRRLKRVLAGIGLGGTLSLGATIINAQSVITSVPAGLGWMTWLQNVVNVMKVIEMSAFVFSGYQFWKGRRERKQADAEAAEQARIDSVYQAWQVINSAQGKGGSGGRIEALRDLLRNQVSLAGINLEGAWLEGVQLPGAMLSQGSLQNINLTRANLAGANLEGADLRNATLVTANLAGARLRGANLSGARLSASILDDADLREIVGWNELASISYTCIQGVRNAPEGFVAFAREHGAVDDETPTPLEEGGISFSQQFRIV